MCKQTGENGKKLQINFVRKRRKLKPVMTIPNKRVRQATEKPPEY